MDFNYYEKDDTLIVALTGEIDQHVAVRYRNKIDLLLRDERIHRIIFDMKHVTFMDSSGIGLLLGRYKLMKKRHGSVGICNTSTRINKIIELAGLYQIINKYGATNEI